MMNNFGVGMETEQRLCEIAVAISDLTGISCSKQLQKAAQAATQSMCPKDPEARPGCFWMAGDGSFSGASSVPATVPS